MNGHINLDDNYEPLNYRALVEEQQAATLAFSKEHPTWILKTFGMPLFNEKFMPQDMSNWFMLLIGWLTTHCVGEHRLFLGCIFFERSSDADFFQLMWSNHAGMA